MTKIAVSNLAWRKSEDKKVFEIMRDLNVLNLEVSPFRDGGILPEARKQFYDETIKLAEYIIKIMVSPTTSTPNLEYLKQFEVKETTRKLLNEIQNVSI